jgi:hypothetical protein
MIWRKNLEILHSWENVDVNLVEVGNGLAGVSNYHLLRDAAGFIRVKSAKICSGFHELEYFDSYELTTPTRKGDACKQAKRRRKSHVTATYC